jgi:hypothetical protein
MPLAYQSEGFDRPCTRAGPCWVGCPCCRRRQSRGGCWSHDESFVAEGERQLIRQGTPGDKPPHRVLGVSRRPRVSGSSSKGPPPTARPYPAAMVRGCKGHNAPKAGAGRAPSRCARPKPLSKSVEARGVIHSWFAYQNTPHFSQPTGKNGPTNKYAGAFVIGFSLPWWWWSSWIGAHHWKLGSNSDRR